MHGNGMSRRHFLGVGINSGLGYDSSSVTVLWDLLVRGAYLENSTVRGR